MKHFLFITILSVCLMGISCSKKTGNGPSASISEKNGVTYVDNQSYSEKRKREFILKEELSIGGDVETDYLFLQPYLLRLDDHGRIYVMDGKDCRVKVFNNSGHYLKRIGNKGPGPFELLLPTDMTVDTKQKIHILDYKNRKIVRYLFDGPPEPDLKLNEGRPDQFFFLPDGFYLVLYTSFVDKVHEKGRLIKYTYSGEILLRSQEFLKEILQMEGRGQFTSVFSTPFDPAGYFALGTDKCIYYGFSDKFEIVVFDPFFKKVRVIRKIDHNRIKVSAEKKRKFLDWLQKKSSKKGFKIKSTVKFPEYHQTFLGIWFNDAGRMLVHIPSDDNKVHIDVFDKEGVYLEEMIIAPPEDGIRLRWIFNRPVFKKGNIYSIVQDEDGLYLVKKYKIVSL